MSWPGERQRHAMSSRGVSTKKSCTMTDGSQKQLNPNERKVFQAMVEHAHSVTGGDFGYPDEIVEMASDLNLTPNQVKGYISDLQKKGLIRIQKDKGVATVFTVEVEVKPEDFIDYDNMNTCGLESIVTPYTIRPTDVNKWSEEQLQHGHEDITKEFLMLRRAKVPINDPAWKYVLARSTQIATVMNKKKIRPKKLEQIKIEYAKKLSIPKSEFDLPARGVREQRQRRQAEKYFDNLAYKRHTFITRKSEAEKIKQGLKQKGYLVRVVPETNRVGIKGYCIYRRVK